MARGFLARRIYRSPNEWRRDAVLLVDEETGSVSVKELDGVEPPATIFVDGVILPFEPKVDGSGSLDSLLLSQFPEGGASSSHYWLLDYPGIFSGMAVPSDPDQVKIVQLC